MGISDLLFNILSIGLKPLYDWNNRYYTLINNFRKNLSRPQQEAKKLKEEDVSNNSVFKDTIKFMTVLNLSTHKTTISEKEIDVFYNELRDFNYRFVFFKKYYKSFTKNLMRFNPKSENGNFDLVILQEVLKDNSIHPLKPFDVLIYHIRYKFKLTSKFYIWYKKKKIKMDFKS